jgi:hypothetical protein
VDERLRLTVYAWHEQCYNEGKWGNGEVGVKNLFRWGLIVLVQIFAAVLVVFLLAGIWHVEAVTTYSQFFGVVFSIWGGFLAGAYVAGMLFLRKGPGRLAWERLLWSA